jgi:biotin operon repressor
VSEKNYPIPVSNGIFAHRKKIGAAIWVFLWLIDHTTKETPAADGKVDGLVHNGSPVPLKTMAAQLDMSRDAVYEQLVQLTKAGYIRKIIDKNGRPNGYAVVNSKRFANRRTKAGRSALETVVQNTVGTVVQKQVDPRTFPGRPSYKSPSIYKEEVLQDNTRHRSNNETGTICAEMIAQGVKKELGLGGSSIILCLTEICRSKLDNGADPTSLRNDLVRAWSAYKVAKPNLKWSHGSPEKFYVSDTWDNPDLWPWKDGARTVVAQPAARRYDSIDDKLAEIGAPRVAS